MNMKKTYQPKETNNMKPILANKKIRTFSEKTNLPSEVLIALNDFIQGRSLCEEQLYAVISTGYFTTDGKPSEDLTTWLKALLKLARQQKQLCRFE